MDKLIATVTEICKSVKDDLLLRIERLEQRAPIRGEDGAVGQKGLDGAAGRDGIDGKDGAPGPPGKDAPAVDLEALAARVLAQIPIPKDGQKGETGDNGLPGRDGVAGLPGRDGLVGPEGKQGLDGRTGLNGLSGRDGTLENMKMLFDGERTVTFCFKNGDPIDGGSITFPVQIYRGVYQAGKVYDLGDTVTYGNSQWYCHAAGTVTPPGEASKLWQLCVRAGRDGKDLRETAAAPPAGLPVVRTR